MAALLPQTPSSERLNGRVFERFVAVPSRKGMLIVPPSVGEVSDSDQIDWLVVVVIK